MYDEGTLMIRDVPVADRPRERLIHQGVTSLSNAELIAILIRTGTPSKPATDLAAHLLALAGGIKGLMDLKWSDLTRVRGIGQAKAVQILAGIELGRRVSRSLPDERVVIHSPKDVANYVMDDLRYLKQEHFVCLFLDTKNQVIDKQCIFVGTLNASVVHPREVFREAVRRSCAGIICVHNHPSGDPTPSKEDLLVTKRLLEASRIMGIFLFDHIIIGDLKFYSLKEKGLIPA